MKFKGPEVEKSEQSENRVSQGWEENGGRYIPGIRKDYTMQKSHYKSWHEANKLGQGAPSSALKDLLLPDSFLERTRPMYNVIES